MRRNKKQTWREKKTQTQLIAMKMNKKKYNKETVVGDLWITLYVHSNKGQNRKFLI